MASQLAESISEAIDSTTNNAELIDRVIAENGEVSCIYCGELSFKGLTIENGRWTSVAQKQMADHMLNCSKRPEAKLTTLITDARKYVQMALASLHAEDIKTAKMTLTDVLNLLSGRPVEWP